jgi:plastocyanin
MTAVPRRPARRSRRLLVGLAALVLAAAATLASLVAVPAPPPREIVLTARNMAFYLDGNPTPNPTVHVRAGERVTVTLRSEDAGITHDFAVKAWQVGTALLSGKGTVSVSFRVPEAPPGAQEYVCSAHAVMMRGKIAVQQ